MFSMEKKYLQNTLALPGNQNHSKIFANFDQQKKFGHFFQIWLIECQKREI